MSQPAPRRVVTGHDAQGVSVVLSDGAPPVHRELPGSGVSFYEIWNTQASPAPITPREDPDPTIGEVRVPPPPHGTKIRINEFPPGQLDERGLQSPIHRTRSIDYGIVLEGEIVLVLDDSEVTLRTGDIVVQRGTDHAWANRSDRVCRVAFILVDGEFTSELLDILPKTIDADLMHDDPTKGR